MLLRYSSAGCLETAGVAGGRELRGWLGRSTLWTVSAYPCIGSQLLKHTNHAAVAGSRASQAFVSFLQCSSPERIKKLLQQLSF